MSQQAPIGVELVQSDREHFLTIPQRRSLEHHLKESRSVQIQQRIQIMLMADRGKSTAEICEELGCALVTAEYWANAVKAGEIDLWQSKPIGRPRKTDRNYIEQLQQLLSSSPRQYGYPFERWTIDWLRKHLAQTSGIVVSSRHLKRLLKELGLSTCKKSPTNRLRQIKTKSIVVKDLAPSSIPSVPLGNPITVHESQLFFRLNSPNSNCSSIR